jgi:hypothetical protein
MDATTIGNSALTGWRSQVGDRGARLVSKRTPLRTDQARAVFGWLFLALSVIYVARTLVRASRA